MPEERLDLLDGQLRVLDGGLATELERRGADLSGGLWSARLLRDDPELIRQVHLDYLEAGSDCVITSSYQASFAGFRASGCSDEEIESLLRRSVELARRARDELWSRTDIRVGRPRPLVAASIGPYGAARADGSEYTGTYDLDESGLVDFHRRRWDVLTGTQPDLLACETIPSLTETRALRKILEDTTGPPAWISFQCRDEAHLADGTRIAEAAALVAASARVIALGVNCTPPELVGPLLRRLRAVSPLPLIAYPNSGETWNASTRSWESDASTPSLATFASEWIECGARWIGGCCRTRPADIRRLRDAVDVAQQNAELRPPPTSTPRCP